MEGTLVGNDDNGLTASSNDERYLVKDTTQTGNQLKTVLDLELDSDYTGVDADDEIDIRFEGHALEANVSGRILLKDQNSGTGEFVEFKTFTVFTTPSGFTEDRDTYRRVIPTEQSLGPLARDYVNSTGRIDVRIEMTRPWQSGFELTSRYDLIQVVVVDND